MATYYNPLIVRDGLVLCLDAASIKSYPGTGTSWIDLSGNGKNGTLSGGAFFTDSEFKTIEFDGVNDIVNFGTGNTFFPLPQFTIEVWFRSFGTVPTTGTQPALYGFTYGFRCLVGETALSFSVDNGVNLTTTNTVGNIPFRGGGWYCSTLTHTGSIMSMYINGELNVSVTRSWSGATRWPTNTWNLGRDNNNSFYFFYGQIPIYRMYNRCLSGQEIQQNYNATRQRFGI